MKREDDGPNSLNKFLTAPTNKSPAAPMKSPVYLPVAGLKSHEEKYGFQFTAT